MATTLTRGDLLHTEEAELTEVQIDTIIERRRGILDNLQHATESCDLAVQTCEDSIIDRIKQWATKKTK